MGEKHKKNPPHFGRKKKKKEIEEIFTAAIEGNKEGKTAVEDD